MDCFCESTLNKAAKTILIVFEPRKRVCWQRSGFFSCGQNVHLSHKYSVLNFRDSLHRRSQDFRCGGLTSRRQSAPASPYCVSYDVSAGPFPGPFSSCWCVVTSLVLTRMDYGNANLAGISLYLLRRLKSVMNSAARLVFLSWRYGHISHHVYANCTG